MFRRSKQNLPQTNVFLVLELIKKLYTYRAAESRPQRRVRMHDKNVEHLDRENWILIFKKIIEIFEKHECSFNDNEYTDALINLLERYAEAGWNDSLDTQLKKLQVRPYGRIWRNLSNAANEINSFIDEFCASNPRRCSMSGEGIEKLLTKLEHNKINNFSQWLFIQENKLS